MRVVGFVCLVLVLSAVGWRYFMQESQQRPRGGVVGVVAHSVSLENMVSRIEAQGSTQAEASIVITPEVAERVTRILFDDGANVAQGDILLVLEQAEEQARLQAAQIDLLESQREYKRIQGLAKAKKIATSELDARKAIIEANQAQISILQAQLKGRTIHAPFSGRVGLREVSIGALVRPGEKLTTLDDISLLHVDFAVPERHANAIKKGMVVRATTEAFDQKVFEGIVETIDTRVDQASRSLLVRAAFKNDGGLLLPGMLLQLTIVLQQAPVIAVPEQALYMRGGEHYVFIVTAENSIEERKVEIGRRQLGIVEIKAGLSEGESIVKQGVLKVKPGAKVNLQQEDWRAEGVSQSSAKNMTQEL